MQSKNVIASQDGTIKKPTVIKSKTAPVLARLFT